MDDFVRLVSDGLSVAGALVSAYLALGIAVSFIEGQMAAASGRSVALADIMVRVSVLVACLAIVAFARLVADDVAAVVGGGLDLPAMRAAILRIAAYFLDVLIGASVVVAAVAIALGFLDGQIGVLVGEAHGVSVAIGRVVGVIVMLVGGLFTVWIAHVIVGALSPAA